MGNKNKQFDKPVIAEKPKKEEVKVDSKPIEEIEEVDGVVDGVDSNLNVRETPEVKSDNIKTLIRKGLKIVVVDPKKEVKGSGESWYKIKVTDVKPAIEGYVMKKYIKII